MHQANIAVRAALDALQHQDIRQLQIDGPLAAKLDGALRLDAVSYYYSACISAFEGLDGLSAGRFSWAMVKLYYSSFYSVRAFLAANGVGLVYYRKKPFSVVAQSPTFARKEKGNTHEVVFNILANRFPSSVLLNEITSIRSFDWLRQRREEANYKSGRFVEPMIPQHFDFISSKDFSATINSYIADEQWNLTFLPDHAAIALPLRTLLFTRRELDRTSHSLDEQGKEYLIKSSPSACETLNLPVLFCEA